MIYVILHFVVYIAEEGRFDNGIPAETIGSDQIARIENLGGEQKRALRKEEGSAGQDNSHRGCRTPREQAWMEGATRALSQLFFEGKAPRALPVEGATRAPLINRLFPSERDIFRRGLSPGSGFYLPYVDRTDLVPRYLRNGVQNIEGKQVHGGLPEMEAHKDQALLQVVDHSGPGLDVSPPGFYHYNSSCSVDA